MADMELFERWKAAFHKMDDRAQEQLVRQAERAASEFPRTAAQEQALRLVPTLAPVVQLKRVVNR